MRNDGALSQPIALASQPVHAHQCVFHALHHFHFVLAVAEQLVFLRRPLQVPAYFAHQLVQIRQPRPELFFQNVRKGTNAWVPDDEIPPD